MHEEELKRKARQRLPDELTEVERHLAQTDFARLAREWKRRLGYEIRGSDFRDLGKLNEKQVELPRRSVLQILKRRRNIAHIEAAREEGIEILQCDICEEQYVKGRGHNCFVTSWVTSTTRGGLPHKKQLVVSQSGKGAVKIGQQYAIDKNKLEKEREKMTQYRIANDDAGTSTIETQLATSTPPQSTISDVIPLPDHPETPSQIPASPTSVSTVPDGDDVDSPLIVEAGEMEVSTARWTPDLFYVSMMRALQDADCRYFYEALSEDYSE